MVEQVSCKDQVLGSNPSCGSRTGLTVLLYKQNGHWAIGVRGEHESFARIRGGFDSHIVHMGPEWLSVLNIGLSAVLAFAGSWWGSYLASKKATYEVEKEIKEED